jgi:outer membrane protein
LSLYNWLLYQKMKLFPGLLMKSILILLLIIPLSTFAQKKIGHVNSQELLDAMPEMQAAKTKIDSLGKAYDKELKQLQARFEIAYNENDHEEAKRIEERIYSFKEAIDSEINGQSEELFKPIRSKLKKAIEDVAKEENYVLVLDSKYDAIVLYSKPGSDITTDVKKKLGL